MARDLQKLTRTNERFSAIRADYEEVEIERDCETGMVRVLRRSEDRWRTPDDLVAHLQWCIEQVRKLPKAGK